MSNLTPSLRFDFTSTYATKSNSGSDLVKVKDITGNGYDGTVATGCNIITDPIMGPCMSFDGSDGNVKLPALPNSGNTDFANGMTITAWISAQNLNGPCILDLYTDSASSANNENLSFQLGNDGFYFQFTDKSHKAATSIEPGQWYHLAITISTNGNVRLYKNGEEIGSKKKLHKLKSVAFNDNAIGKGKGDNDVAIGYFKGNMAWLSIYNTALDMNDIQADMVKGESNRTVTFRKSLPIDFQVYSKSNNDNAPVLYVEQAGDGQDLYLEITNNTASPISIPVAQSGEIASENKYHFQLHFRPGTLSSSLLGTAQTIGNWSVAIGSSTASNEEYIRFLCTSAVDAIAATNGSLLLKVPKVSANAQGGARNTNVSLQYSLGNDLEGQRMQSLSIVNHSGQKDIPLHVDVVGAPQVLNDGSSENDLLFRIENIGTDPIPLSTITTQKSIFEVGVMVQPLGELMEWAMVKQEDVSSLALDWPVIGVVASSTPSGATFSITLEEPLAATLPSGSKIIVKPTSGAAGIYTLTSAANAGQREIATNSTTAIEGGAIISLSSNLGILSASTSTVLTLSTALPFQIASGTALTIAPPADVIAQAKSWAPGTGKGTLTLGADHSLPAGRKVYLVTHVGKAKASVNKATAVSLLTPHTGSINPGTSLSIVTPTGEEHSASISGQNSDGTVLIVTNPLTIPQDSDISYHQLLGTVKTATTNAKTLVLTTSGVITVSEGSLLVIKPASDTVQIVTTSGKSSEGQSTVNIKASATVQESSILSLASAISPWQVLENSLVTSAISGLQQWTITNESVQEIVSGGSIEFLLRDIICGLPAGQSLVTVRYYNIPGYWDGKFVIPITKGPIVSSKQNVGIGVKSSPNATLKLDYPGSSHQSILIGETTANSDEKPGGLVIVAPGDSISTAHPIKLIDSTGNKVMHIKQNGNINTQGTLTTVGDISAGSNKIETTGEISTGTLSASRNITTSGKVGIGLGTDTPDSPLVVRGVGTQLVLENNQLGPAKLQKLTFFLENNGFCAIGIPLGFGFDVAGSEKMRLNATGQLGIGTATPATGSLLDVNGTITGTGLSISGPTLIGQDNTKTMPGYTGTPGGLAVSWNNSANNRGEVDLYNTNSAPGGDAFHFYQMTSSGNATLLVALSQNGNLGIGTSVPGYPIDVVGGTFQSYTGKNSTSPPKEYGDGFTSSGNQIFASVEVNIGAAYLGNSYVAHSDNRLKDIIAKANSKNDLETVLQLSVTNYSYKNKARLGNRENKGLIAQELEKVFPHAVSQHTGFTPDIYSMAKEIKRNKKKNELTIHLDKKHGLKKGDIVRLITDSDENLEKKVTAVPDSKKVVVKDWKEKTKKLFVYGKKVDDLRGIDYHQVAMLGISATQQLHKELEATQAENKTLRKDAIQLKKQCNRIEKQAETQRTQHKTDMADLKKELNAIKKIIKNLQ